MRKILRFLIPVGIFAVLIAAYPPSQAYDSNDLVISLLNEVIVKKFEPNNRPIFEWHDGERHFWNDNFPSINIYGCTSVADQTMILSEIKARLEQFRLPGIEVGFFTEQATKDKPAELEGYHTVTKDYIAH